MRYNIQDDGLYYGDKHLSSVGSIIVDGHQDIVKRRLTDRHSNVVVKNLAVGDYVLVTQDGLVACIEEKKWGDLETSWRQRRLQRQLRQVKDSCDIPCLALRLPLGKWLEPVEYDSRMLQDLTKWQLMGGLILLIPKDPAEVIPYLQRSIITLKPGPHQLSILAGTDEKPKGIPTARALQAGIKGLGPKTAAKLVGTYGTDLVKILQLDDEAWKKIGANKHVLKNRQELYESREELYDDDKLGS